MIILKTTFLNKISVSVRKKKKNSSTASLTIQSDIIRILLGRELGMSNEGVAWLKGMKTDLYTPSQRHPGEFTYILQNDHRDLFNSCTCALGTQWTQTNHSGYLK